MNVSVREFKDRLSKYLRLVGEGEPVVITSHNKPVAILNPVARTDKPSLQQLLAAGKLKEATYDRCLAQFESDWADTLVSKSTGPSFTMRRRWPPLTDCGATTAFTSRPRTFSINSPGNPCTLPASTNASTQPPGASACNSSRASGLLTECLKVLPARGV
jgi:prevent-host-death family protein